MLRALTVLVISVLMVTGCGGKGSKNQSPSSASVPSTAPVATPVPSSPVTPAPAPAPAPAAVSIQNLPSFDPPTNLYALAKQVNLLAFEITGSTGTKARHTMKTDGTESINGQETIRLLLTNTSRNATTESTLWVKADGSAVQFASGNRTWGLPEAAAVGTAAGAAILNVFASVKDGGLISALETARNGGALGVEITSDKRTFLGLPSTLITFVLPSGPSALTWVVADFGSMAMVVRSETKFGDNILGLFEIVELKLN